MRFNKLEIENFRGIDKAELKELKDINLIVGKNNSGKTSILEAIFVLSGMSNPSLLPSINLNRGLKLKNDSDFKYIFNDLNLKEPIMLSGNVSGTKRSAKISVYKDEKQNIFPFDVSVDSLRSKQIMLQNQVDEIDGVKISFSSNGKDKEDVYISLKKKIIKSSKTYKESLNVKWIDSKINEMNLYSIIKKKKIKGLIDILRQIEPNLVDIQILDDNSIYFDVGKEELLPISIMGDGIIRILRLLSSMYEMQGGVLLIDEIENGLHYSSIEVLWKAIIMFTEELDVQIIATTHSYEALRALIFVQENINEKKAEIAMYRIEKKDDKAKIIHYNNDDLIFGISKNYEVR